MIEQKRSQNLPHVHFVGYGRIAEFSRQFSVRFHKGVTKTVDRADLGAAFFAAPGVDVLAELFRRFHGKRYAQNLFPFAKPAANRFRHFIRNGESFSRTRAGKQ